MASAAINARFMTTKVHAWRGKYGRIFTVSPTALGNYDPETWAPTNTWSLAEDFVDFSPSVGDPTEFSITLREGKKNSVMKYQCERRTELLTELVRAASASRAGAVFTCFKVSRVLSRVSCTLEVRPEGLRYALEGERLTTYLYKDMSRVSRFSDDASAFTFTVAGRPRMCVCIRECGHMHIRMRAQVCGPRARGAPARGMSIRIRVCGHMHIRMQVTAAATRLGLSGVLSPDPLTTAAYAMRTCISRMRRPCAIWLSACAGTGRSAARTARTARRGWRSTRC